jgi:hypothetical protein
MVLTAISYRARSRLLEARDHLRTGSEVRLGGVLARRGGRGGVKSQGVDSMNRGEG